MNADSCRMGTRVALVSKTQPCHKGTVKGEVEPHKTHGHVVIVEWDHGALQKVTLRSLITEAEGKDRDAQIKAEEERLEAEWSLAEEQVKAKLQEAANALNEAAALAKKAGHDLLDMYDAAYPLMRAMDNAGWRSSSLSC